LITHVGEHPQFGRNVLLQFSTHPPAKPFMSNSGDLFAFYAHLSVVLVSEGQPVRAGERIALTGATGNASVSAPHLHFEIRDVSTPSPGLGLKGRLDPATVLGYAYLVSS